MADLFDLLPQPLQWWWVKRAGERPQCDACDGPAVWYSSADGYSCPKCEGERTTSVGMLRDLEPRDYLEA